MDIIFKIFLAFALLNLVSLSDLFNDEWNMYKVLYTKNYDQEKEQHHKQNFITNMILINEHNKLYEMGQVTYKMGINQFTDLNKEEFKKFLQPSFNSNKIPNPIKTNFPNLPSQVDWRDEGAVTPIVDQGQSGGCGYGVTGSLEGQYFLNTSRLIPLCQQFLYQCANCTPTCFTEDLFEFAERTGVSAEYQPDMNCDEIAILFKISDYEQTEIGNEIALQSVVANIGPIEVAIDATYLMMYAGGIFSSPDCSSTDLNHETLVVGYGIEDDMDYWIVKNSWGAEWGENGYIRMARNQDNNCGIASFAHYPII